MSMFEEAKKKLIEIDVNQARLSKKKRLLRSDEFYRDIYNQILNKNDDLDDDCNDMLECAVASKLWFRSTCDVLLKQVLIKFIALTQNPSSKMILNNKERSQFHQH